MDPHSLLRTYRSKFYKDVKDLNKNFPLYLLLCLTPCQHPNHERRQLQINLSTCQPVVLWQTNLPGHGPAAGSAGGFGTPGNVFASCLLLGRWEELKGQIRGDMHVVQFFLSCCELNLYPQVVGHQKPLCPSATPFGTMRAVFVAMLLMQFLCSRAETAESCADDVSAALQQQEADTSLELLQVKSAKEDRGESAKSEEEGKWYRYNPPGWRGGPGYGYYHHNPVGWRGGPGYGTTYYHRNPYGPRGGWGHGTTYYHHHGGIGWR